MVQATFRDFRSPRERKIDWKKLIESRDDYPQIDNLDPTYAGWVVHEWIKNRFSYLDVLFDRRTVWKGDDGIVVGKYDAWDGKCIYEFKTVSHRAFSHFGMPREKDAEQMRDYMRSTGTEKGWLVYISRKDFSVREIEFELDL